MKYLIVLALVAAAQARHSLQEDTPEVAAARAAHLAEHARVAARDYILHAPPPVVRYIIVPAPAPVHVPAVTPEGYLVDTPEVAAARAAHLAEHAKATAAAPAFRADPYAEYYRAYYDYYYPSLTRAIHSGHHAGPTVLPSGYLAETPEVAHAKLTHLYKLYKEANRL